MYSDLTSELWGELKRFINSVDRAEAAEIVVSVLIDHDEDPDDIRAAFKTDSDIKSALVEHLGHNKDYEDEDYDEELEEFEDDNWEE